MAEHNLRYYAIGFGSGLIALGGVLVHLGATLPTEYWLGTAAIYGVAVWDSIKHRDST